MEIYKSFIAGKLIIIVSLLLSMSAMCQGYKTITVSGNCLIKKSNSQWVKLLSGTKIENSDKIKLEGNSYVGLIDKNGKSIELTKVGTYSVSDLSKMASERKNVLQRFAGFMINESVNSRKSDNMKTLGAVVRSRGDQIDLLFPLSTNLVQKEIDIKWFSKGPDTRYVVKVLEDDGSAMSIIRTTDTAVTIDLSKIGVINGKTYRFYVYNLNKKEIFSDTVFITISRDSLLKEYETFVQEIFPYKNTLNIVDQLILISWLKNKGYNYDALLEYENLTNMHAELDDVNKDYLNFLLDQGIISKAELMIKKIRANDKLSNPNKKL